MHRTHRAWTIAAGLHLSLAVCGAAGLALPDDSFAGSLLAQYGEVTGADSSYGFFAPAVASQCRARVTTRDPEGHEQQEPLLEETSTTFGLRSATILDAFVKLPDKVRRGVAGSWASMMFGRHPRAEEVVVNVDIQLLPSMAEWRAGQRATWKSIYQGTFVRAAAAGSDGPASATASAPAGTSVGAR